MNANHETLVAAFASEKFRAGENLRGPLHYLRRSSRRASSADPRPLNSLLISAHKYPDEHKEAANVY
jgi:hypothetical protein